MKVDSAVAFAGDGRADRVDDAQRHGALFLRLAQGGQRVGRLARLADHDHHRPVLDDRVAVAELAGVLHFRRNPRQVLEQVVAHQPRVPGRPARGQDDPLGLDQLADHGRQAAQGDPLFPHVQTAAETGADHLRLLEDLLEHEMFVTVQRDLLEFPFDLLDFLGDRNVVDRGRPHAVAADDDHLVVVQVDDVRRVLDDGRGVGGDQVLAVAHAHDQRAAAPRGHQLVRLQDADHRDAVRPADFLQRRRHRLLQRDALDVHLPHQVREDLRVGLALEDVALGQQKLLERGIVLDDAVVDQRDPPGVVKMRVGVEFVGFTMRSPAGVRDADRAFLDGRIGVDQIFQHGDASGRLVCQQRLAGVHADPGGVIPAILQALEALDQHGAGLLVADITDNSAHGWLLWEFIDRFSRRLETQARHGGAEWMITYLCPFFSVSLP